MFVLWLGEKITDKGIGNGVSIIIMIGIIARLPFAFFAELTSRVTQQGGGLVAFPDRDYSAVFRILRYDPAGTRNP